MLHSINKKKLAKKIKSISVLMNDISSENMASELIESLDNSLESAVQAWIVGDAVPDVATGIYSINKILTIRHSDDYIEAFKLLTAYIQDPIKGEKSIWRPKRIKPVMGR